MPTCYTALVILWRVVRSMSRLFVVVIFFGLFMIGVASGVLRCIFCILRTICRESRIL